MGLSIWSMHFVAMLGFDPGSAVRYDPFLTVVSLLLAIGATGGAFFFAARDGARLAHVLLAGAAMGVGICLMHYVGMAALRTAVSMGYDARLVVLSLAIAIAASTAALLATRREQAFFWRLIAALTLGAAIVGMHYTAMAALELTPAAEVRMDTFGGPPYMLAVSVAGGTLLILLLALMASLYDQRDNVLSALEAGGVGYWELDLRSKSLHVSARGKEIFGLKRDDEITHDQFLPSVATEERAKRDQGFESVLLTGSDYDDEYRLADEARWVNVRGRVLKDGRGRPRRMIGVVLDVTDRHEAFAAVTESERRQRLMVNELNHRVKNTLATIQSIAAQTARRAATPEDFRRSFEGRLVALSETHNALTRGGWEVACLRELFQHELGPYSEEQFRLEGPATPLGPRQALALGMVIHELATNAAKYGALSTPAGCLRVAWAVQADAATLAIEWSEHGGPVVEPPSRKGFGSRLLHLSIEKELGGQAELRYEPDGFVCSLVIPLADMKTQASGAKDFAF
ncbi:MHYT domain-containing protein [Aurantimonas endophytica]|uniref:Blue-light-activated histidine kinase n=1 Tax=Aurantimonas endophytica TaxID=1522175 RepID=A0A7W6MQJ5_9HYPH|nr:MHYT domain-containing protein [Aurantimonas endophytica]MBB4004055.1 PAS domain S-box-containing protein [Aurantimonas endophytica]MCO6404901.1 PAS domain-containing protein [Aurantimonas endophytica]